MRNEDQNQQVTPDFSARQWLPAGGLVPVVLIGLMGLFGVPPLFFISLAVGVSLCLLAVLFVLMKTFPQRQGMVTLLFVFLSFIASELISVVTFGHEPTRLVKVEFFFIMFSMIWGAALVRWLRMPKEQRPR